ncbi:hypothetical protein RUM43_003895, partial [Polyplax serrata]
MYNGAFIPLEINSCGGSKRSRDISKETTSNRSVLRKKRCTGCWLCALRTILWQNLYLTTIINPQAPLHALVEALYLAALLFLHPPSHEEEPSST